ncbi:hypothetical protein ACFOON_01255 [Novosphingobium piscinae]|uniref:Cyclic nucleotide-binding domain-containing protein n=1 Tax=Novosphingobium piscinae TaxID=1507448 RepID=A0A7X1FWS9_9SPHN|nr:hypothetical protein [Novosphingobium piscinae]MBC2667792.1 hypothetical protein [Novosphingobium piscinae]
MKPGYRDLWRSAAFGLALAAALPAGATPTPVLVRVISQDAKFIGDHTGGAAVVLRDAESQAVLAEGRTRGGTGDTGLIMQATGRSPRRATPDTAGFSAVLEIDRPTLVRLEVQGPLDRPGSAVRITAERWIMPGEPVTAGDGWVVELPGLAVTPTVSLTGGMLAVSAQVEPLCGCPIAPGGLWPAADYRVSASLWAGNRRLAEVPLAFTTAPGGFSGQVPLPPGPPATLMIFARNLVTGASGLGRIAVPAAAAGARSAP